MRVAVCLLMVMGVLVGVMHGSSASGLFPRSASLLDQEDTKEKRSPFFKKFASAVPSIAASYLAYKYGRRGLREGFGEADAPLDDRMADRISTLNNNIKRSLSTFNKVSNDGQRRKRQSGEGKLDIFGNPVFVNEIERLNKAGLLNRDDFDILLEEESNFLKDQ